MLISFLFPSNQALFWRATAVSCRMEAEEPCFLLDVPYMPSAQITGPFLTWFLQIPINGNFESPIFSIQSLKNESPLKKVLSGLIFLGFLCSSCFGSSLIVQAEFWFQGLPFKVVFFQSLSHVWLRPHGLRKPGLPVLHYLWKRAQTHVHWVGDAIQPSRLCRSPLLLPSVFPSSRLGNEPALHIRWRKYWSFCFSIRPSSEYSGLISFRIDWFDFLEVQGAFKSLLQYSMKSQIILCPLLKSVY